MLRKQWPLRVFEILLLAVLSAVARPYVEKLVEHTIATHSKVDQVAQRMDTVQVEMTGIADSARETRKDLKEVVRSQSRLLAAQKHTDSAIGRIGAKLDIATGSAVLTHVRQ